MTCFDEEPEDIHDECRFEIDLLKKAIAARDALLRKYLYECDCMNDEEPCDLCAEARKMLEADHG